MGINRVYSRDRTTDYWLSKLVYTSGTEASYCLHKLSYAEQCQT